MPSIPKIIAQVGGQANTSASVGTTAFNAVSGSYLQVIVDAFVRIEFGTSSTVTATPNSTLYAPGQISIIPLNTPNYYSILAPSGTANYSILQVFSTDTLYK